jgi:hypothetical protein
MLAGAGPGGAVELGAPPRWPAAEHQRVLADTRQLQRARARRRLRPAVALAAVGPVILVALGVGAFLAVTGSMLLLAGWWCLAAMSLDTPVVMSWARWVHARRVLERELRLLGSEWRLLWDRRVPGLPAPGIVAVGPSGVWVLWLPEPGPAPGADFKATAEAISEQTGLTAGAYMLTVPEKQFGVFVQQMACAPRAASPPDIARAAELLDSTLLQEPVFVEERRP